MPGNRDVDRTQARPVDTRTVPLRVPDFLDDTETGRGHRQSILPRFAAYIRNDFTASGDHWLGSCEGTSRATLVLRGRRLGVLGLNTAWLSCGEDDRHQLSAGVPLLERGLESLAGCDQKIVLGHHPLDWLRDADAEAVQALLGEHTALYLHGHLHKGKLRYQMGGQPFLSIQAGACFQPAADEDWVNGLVWCELDLDAGECRAEALQWAGPERGWVPDGAAFPPAFRQGDHWAFPLPAPPAGAPAPAKAAGPQPPRPPLGWQWVDAAYLTGHSLGVDDESVLYYFNGREPGWREALARDRIPRRKIVGKLVGQLEAARHEGGLRVTVLYGAAGEGKSTALFQTVCDLVQGGQDWRVLWHELTSTPLPPDFLVRLPATATYLIVSDDAELIAHPVFDVLRLLKEAGRRNVQFLLCCRETDWKTERTTDKGRVLPSPGTLRWNDHARYAREPLQGLDAADARQVVAAWSEFGSEGLLKLQDKGIEEGARCLADAANSGKHGRQEGTFFGALLEVRLGEEGLWRHVETLLKTLHTRPILTGKAPKRRPMNDKTLLHAFAYIAAAHAVEHLKLPKIVLAKALGYDLGNVSGALDNLLENVLKPLSSEAAIATTGAHVFTRHRTIAQVALDLLSAELGHEPGHCYLDLVAAAMRARLDDGVFVPDLANWKFLSSYFFAKGDTGLGIQLADLAHQNNPTEPEVINKLAQLYREAGQPDESVRVFQQIPPGVLRLRSNYFEWGTAVGSAGRPTDSAWLVGFSLADQFAGPSPEVKDATVGLNNLAEVFEELHKRYNLPLFRDACVAAARLWLNFSAKDPASQKWVRPNQERARTGGTETPARALESIAAGIVGAWQRSPEGLPAAIVPGDKLTFAGLAQLLGIH